MRYKRIITGKDVVLHLLKLSVALDTLRHHVL